MKTITIRGLTDDCATRLSKELDAFDDYCGLEYEVKSQCIHCGNDIEEHHECCSECFLARQRGDL